MISELLRFLVAVIICSIFTASPSIAEDDDYSNHMVGNWGGILPSLEESGISVESILTNDYFANVSGGLRRRSATMGNFDLTAAVDSEKAGLWSNGTLFTFVLGNYGNELSKYVGDEQVSSNIEAYSTVKLYEFWYEHTFLNNKASVLFGLHDYNAEFDALEYSSGLINSSFGISNDIAQVGPSIFNTTAVAVRFKVLPTDGTYAMTACYDGVPGDPNRPQGTRVKFDDGDGVFWGGEFGFTRPEGISESRYYKAGVGYWYHTKRFEALDGSVHNRNYGLYGIGEIMLFPEEELDGQGLGVFAQYGHPKSNRNAVGQYIGFGLSYTGIIPGRDEDQLSIGYARAENSDEFMRLNGGFHQAETVVEFSYIAKVLPYLSLQPDLQFVVNPSTDPSISDAVVIGMRAEVAL